ncbi:hypothetical protein LCGC14_1569850 [marine sediment metagenome]|uniref:Uncharacterized protein n=1 Tax=marine sediment metagenome TaxID=412755 RepID=A0A0F9L139_9ZZZZ
MDFIKCPHCGDEVQEDAYSMHMTGQFNGKQVSPIGTCYVLQARAEEFRSVEELTDLHYCDIDPQAMLDSDGRDY